MSSPPVRRSNRPRQSTARYSKSHGVNVKDAFDAAARSDTESDDGLIVEAADNDDSDVFVDGADTPSVDEQDLDDEDARSGAHRSDDNDVEVEDANQQDADDDVDMLDDDGDDDTDVKFKVKVEKTHGNLKPRDPLASNPARGLQYVETRNSKAGTRLGIFGPAQADQEPAMQALYKWKHDLCLPTRKCDRAGFGGFNNGFYRTKAQRQREIDTGWKWYDTASDAVKTTGWDKIRRRQEFRTITEEQANAYRPDTLAKPATIVSGPYAHQTLQSLAINHPVHLDTAFRSAAATNDSSPTKIERHGWYINLGQRIQCLDWATNQSGSDQAFAVSTMPANAFQGVSQFVPRVGLSSIQVWTLESDAEGHIDSTIRPHLAQLICADWGHVKALSWCPAPRIEPPDSSERHLGLLATVWTDGSVRVLDISLSRSDTKTHFQHCSRAAFAARPSHSVYTSVAWLSSTGLVAGSSDGTISVFDLPASFNNDAELASSMMHVVVQPSYIMSVTTCYPSRPQIVCTASTSGAISMTDLLEVSPSSRFSSTHTIPSGKSRIGKTTLAWHDFGQAIITNDDNNGVFTIPLRRFFSTTGASMLSSNCIVHAVSPCHPFIVMGTVGGEAILTDPMKRLVSSKARIWIQNWFAHEFRPDYIPDTQNLHTSGLSSKDVSDRDDDSDAVDSTPTSPAPGPTPVQLVENTSIRTGAGKPRDGKVRFLEGFKPENIQLDRAKRARVKDGAPVTLTVYEPETAIVSVAWNPNVHVAGWCLAGMASGIIRVEDIAKDKE